MSELHRRIAAVPPPPRVLHATVERRLTNRQRSILHDLAALFDEGFSDLTMAEIARRQNCSLRTLYALAPSREHLVLLVVDQRLWRAGRAARDAVGPDPAALDAVRAYLHAATVAVSTTTQRFASDLAASPGTVELRRGHNEYLFAVTKCLLDLAVENGEIADVDTTAVGRVLAGLASELAQPAVISKLRGSAKEAADAVVDLLILGMQRQRRDETD